MKFDLQTRLAVADDARNLWQWRNDEVTRKNSPNSEEVSWADHSAWFEAALGDDQKTIYIAEDTISGDGMGMVRFDDDANNTAAVSINLNPEWRGKKIASTFLNEAITQFQRDNTVILTAEIKPHNIPSIRCFERCGFSLYDTFDDVLLFKNKQGIIDAIEAVRSNNNVNWMDLMRLAFRVAPKEAEEILGRINSDDGRISRLVDLLSK